MGDILQWLMSFGARAAYTVILAVIVVLCASEIYKTWFDRSLVLTVFEFTKNGTPVVANGEAFSHRIEQQERVLKRMFESKGGATGGAILTEEARLQFGVGDLNVARLSTSDLADLKIEAQGVNLTALLGRLRNWIRPSNAISGRVDQIDDIYHVFVEWRGRRGDGESQEFYNRAHDDLGQASFQIAARLFWQELSAVARPTGLAKSLVEDFTPDDFVTFMEVWTVYRAPEGEPKKRKAALEGAIEKMEILTRRDRVFPLSYKILANLKALAKPLDTMSEDEKAAVKALLQEYLAAMNTLKLKDETAREQLASLEQGEVAAQRVAAAVTEVRGEAPPDAATMPRQVALAGGSISPADYASAASACCIVADRDGNQFVVTADYLFPPEILAKSRSPEVLSPAAVDGGTEPIGQLDRIHQLPDNSAGIALIKLNDDVEGRNTIPGGGKIEGLADRPQPGDTVVLYGRTSQGSKGKILEQGVTANQVQQIQQQAAPQVERLLGVERISQPGDGGAPVVDTDNRLVGMAYKGAPNMSLILPLTDLLNELGLTLVTD